MKKEELRYKCEECESLYSNMEIGDELFCPECGSRLDPDIQYKSIQNSTDDRPSDIPPSLTTEYIPETNEQTKVVVRSGQGRQRRESSISNTKNRKFWKINIIAIILFTVWKLGFIPGTEQAKLVEAQQVCKNVQELQQKYCISCVMAGGKYDPTIKAFSSNPLAGTCDR